MASIRRRATKVAKVDSGSTKSSPLWPAERGTVARRAKSARVAVIVDCVAARPRTVFVGWKERLQRERERESATGALDRAQ